MILFALRGLAVSLSVFVLAYIALRLFVACGFALTRQRFSWLSPNALYALQVGPFALAAVVVSAFAIPSFLRFEPRVVEEAFGPPVILLSLVCLTLLALGLYRAHQAHTGTTRAVRAWGENATPIDDPHGLSIYQTGKDAPPLVVTGYWRPKLLVSSSTSNVLSEDELALAIAHESAHVKRRDNLKKLTVRFCSIPRPMRIEKQWLAALEVDADQHAVHSRREALDLASALVKASRITIPPAELTTSLTGESGTLLQVRVQRLLDWNGTQQSSRLLRYGSMLLATLATLAIIASYSSILLQMHHFAELLMD